MFRKSCCFVVVLIATILSSGSAYCIKVQSARFAYLRRGCSAYSLASTPLKMRDNDLGRELDTFFERAAESGSDTIRKLTPAERAERAVRGEFLEDEIFDVRGRLMSLEDDLMRGKDVDIEYIKQVREELDCLKRDYMELVGANDLPIYFGKVPDSLQ